NIYGEQRYAMRIWLDADSLGARGLTVADVERALTTQNIELPAGTLESADKDYTIRVARNYARPEDFAQLPITATGTSGVQGAGGAANAAGYITRLGDIARIEEAP